MKPTNKPIKPAFTYHTDLVGILQQRGKEPDLPIKTIPDLNRKIWGLKRQQLVVLGAYTSHGKSTLALQISRDLAIQDFAVLYLSLEMPVTKCLERLLCQHHRIPNTDLLTGKYKDYEASIDVFKHDIERWRLIISDCIGFTWQEVDSLIEKLTTKPDIIILDYAQMTKGTGRIAKDSYDDYIKHFREMAIRHNFCAVLVSQIGRASKADGSKDPQLHHLQGTSVFEQHADCVILCKWNYRDTNNELDFHKYTVFISKNRDGATGYCELYFKPEIYSFFDVAANEEKKEDWNENANQAL